VCILRQKNGTDIFKDANASCFQLKQRLCLSIVSLGKMGLSINRNEPWFIECLRQRSPKAIQQICIYSITTACYSCAIVHTMGNFGRGALFMLPKQIPIELEIHTCVGLNCLCWVFTKHCLLEGFFWPLMFNHTLLFLHQHLFSSNEEILCSPGA